MTMESIKNMLRTPREVFAVWTAIRRSREGGIVEPIPDTPFAIGPIAAMQQVREIESRLCQVEDQVDAAEGAFRRTTFEPTASWDELRRELNL